MTFLESATIGAVLALSGWLAAKASPGGRIVVLFTAVFVAAAMFLPRPLLHAIAGHELLRWISRIASALPWSLSTIAHFCAFLWLSAVVWLLRPDWRGWRGLAVLVVLAVAAEAMQLIGEVRNANVEDVLVNLMGVAAGIAMAEAIVGLAGLVRPKPPDSVG